VDHARRLTTEQSMRDVRQVGFPRSPTAIVVGDLSPAVVAFVGKWLPLRRLPCWGVKDHG
jgi:hypothetical protein